MSQMGQSRRTRPRQIRGMSALVPILLKKDFDRGLWATWIQDPAQPRNLDWKNPFVRIRLFQIL